MRTHQVKKMVVVAIGVLVLVVVVIQTARTPSVTKFLSKAGNSNTPIKGGDVADALANLGFKRSNEQLEQAKKLTETTKKLVDEQSKRIGQLEQHNIQLERELGEMKRPPNDLSLREKLAFVHPYDAGAKFPAYLWQSWRYGLNDNQFGDEYKKGEETWVDLNPGFVHEIFNDETATAFVHYLYRNIPEILQVYDRLPAAALRVDFFRYLMLFAKGGVWADIDTTPLKPVPNWIPDNVKANELGMIVGVEADRAGESKDEWQKKRARKVQFSNAVIQAKPGHPVLRDLIATITEETKKKLAASEGNRLSLPDNNREIAIQGWTGNGVFTDTILKYFSDWMASQVFAKVTWKDFVSLENPKLVSDVLVLPKQSFEADITRFEGETPEEPGPLVYVKHRKAKVYDM